MAYLGVDIGGTKTLFAVFDDNGVIEEQNKIHTPQDYDEFLKSFRSVVDSFTTKSFNSTGVALPGILNRQEGIAIAFAHLPWKNVHIKEDVKNITGSPVVIENDAKLAGLSEAIILKSKYKKVLYVTISTGIGAGIIVDDIIESNLVDCEAGLMYLEHEGQMKRWEDFASGSAFVKQNGKLAQEIVDPAIWKEFSINLSKGLLPLIATIQPGVVILGGGVGAYFERYSSFVEEELNKYGGDMVPIPPIKKAERADEAVVYGSYYLAKAAYDNVHQQTQS